MSKQFFDSEIVKESLEDIRELQEIVQGDLIAQWYYGGDYEGQGDQLDVLEELLEKQQLMYVRCKLSKDPDAKLIADSMADQLKLMGMPRGTTVEKMFENLKGAVKNLRETLDN
tara:strand:+ start:832 stop:1173 length:342 start_codon:yes stop_codon:yes gene_type:complete